MSKQEIGRITWTTVQVRLSELVEWERNPRQLTDRQARDLGESLTKFGLVQPLVANADFSLIGGHQRKHVLALIDDYGPDAVVDVRIPDRMLSPRECEELNVRLNKNTGEWDFDALANYFDVDDLLNWGFNEMELGLLGEGAEGEAGEYSDGSLLELLAVTIDEPRHEVTSGDVWRVGHHYLICVDVLVGWEYWVDFLVGDAIFAPYPGPLVPLTNKASDRYDHRLVMVQPDPYIAGHILDRYADVHGEDEVRRHD